MEDWYNVSFQDITANGGAGLLKRYSDSHFFAIIHVYDEYKWELWRFSRLPNKFWESEENARKCLEWAGKKLTY